MSPGNWIFPIDGTCTILGVTAEVLMYNFGVLPWSIPAKKAAKGLLYWLAIPLLLVAIACILFDQRALSYGPMWAGISKILFTLWFLRQVIRFAMFAFVRKRTSRFTSLQVL
jgi:hypothetical protein